MKNIIIKFVGDSDFLSFDFTIFKIKEEFKIDEGENLDDYLRNYIKIRKKQLKEIPMFKDFSFDSYHAIKDIQIRSYILVDGELYKNKDNVFNIKKELKKLEIIIEKKLEIIKKLDDEKEFKKQKLKDDVFNLGKEKDVLIKKIDKYCYE